MTTRKFLTTVACSAWCLTWLVQAQIWVGEQADCANPPARGSWWDGANWEGFTPPTGEGLAILQEGQREPAFPGTPPHYIHFGDFNKCFVNCPNPVFIPAASATAVADDLAIINGHWTLDFTSGHEGAGCSDPPPVQVSLDIANWILIGSSGDDFPPSTPTSLLIKNGTVTTTVFRFGSADVFPTALSLDNASLIVSSEFLNVGTSSVQVSLTGASTLVVGADMVFGPPGRPGIDSFSITDGSQASIGGTLFLSTGLETSAVVDHASLTAARISVGESGGNATLSVTESQVSATDPASESNIGVAGGSATVTLSGPSAEWTSAGLLSIGRLGGTGELTIGSGARLTSAFVRVGIDPESEGLIRIVGSEWVANGNVQAGVLGHGRLVLTGGSTCQISGDVRLLPLGNGFASLEVDAGAQCNITGDLTLGGFQGPNHPAALGTALLEIGGGATVTAGNLDILNQEEPPVVRIEVGPTGGQLNVAGDALLGGRLELVPVGGLACGDTFDVLVAGSVDGTFEEIVAPDFQVEVLDDRVRATYGLAPQILEQPSDVSVHVGDNISLHVETDTAAGSFQWFRGDVPLSDDVRIQGASTDTLVIFDAQPGDTGGYVVLAAACEGGPSVQSEVATVSVLNHCAPGPPARFAPGGIADGDYFSGRGVAHDRQIWAISAVGHDSAGIDDSGAVYVFTEGSPATLEQTAVLAAANPQSGAYLGWWLGVSGDMIAAGAPFESVGGVATGAVHVFRLAPDGSWFEEAVVAPSAGGADDQFGENLALQGDLLVVGAPQSDVAGVMDAGRSYIYRRGQDGIWTEIQQLTSPNPHVGQRFGDHAAIDGDTLVIGSPLTTVGGLEGAGAVYVYEGDGNAFQLTQVLTAANPVTGGRFGNRFALDGDTLAIGATGSSGTALTGTVDVFVRDGSGQWLHQQTVFAPDAASDDSFGFLDLDGDLLAVGALHDDDQGSDSGSCYVFSRSSDNAWQLEGKLVPEELNPGDEFGLDVGLCNNTLVVGANGHDAFGTDAGAVFVYNLACMLGQGDVTGDGCVDADDLARLLGNFGVSSGVSADGGDLNGDGAVGLTDLAILLAVFGSGCGP